MKNRRLYDRVTEEDFQQHIMGRRARRRRNVRRVLRVSLTALLCVAALAGGFVGMDALLRVSELPLPEGQQVTEPMVTTTQPETLPAREGPAIKSFYVPILMMDNRNQSAQLQQQAKDLGSNTAVMTFKDGNGYLTYRSNLMQQSLLKSNEKARYRTDWTSRDLSKKAEQRIIAVIHCFDDPLAAGRMTEAAILQRDTGSVPWMDAQGKRWLNPWSEAAREYLLAVVREVIAFGANDILLCGLRFPDGNLQAAEFPGAGEADPADPAARNAVLRSFIEEAREAAGEAAELYVLLTAQEAREGSDAIGGELWGCAADYIAVDVRGVSWNKNDPLWNTRPTLPVIATPEDTKGMRDYIVLTDEAQG